MDFNKKLFLIFSVSIFIFSKIFGDPPAPTPSAPLYPIGVINEAKNVLFKWTPSYNPYPGSFTYTIIIYNDLESYSFSVTDITEFLLPENTLKKNQKYTYYIQVTFAYQSVNGPQVNIYTSDFPAPLYNIQFKIRELKHGTGANIENVKVDIDNGSYIGFTDANGVIHLNDVTEGTHKIKVSKPGYIQFTQDGYILSTNQIFNASILSKVRIGPWGTDNFNVNWWRQTFAYVGEWMGNVDNPRWKQTAPIFNRISPNPTWNPIYYSPDSINIVAAIDEIESKTGYDLITLVPRETSPDTSYTLYPRTGNFSTIGFDENYIIFSGYSGFAATLPSRRIIHEIVKQFGMWPIYSNQYVSVMEPNIGLMADMQVWDADNIAVTFDQHYAKQRGEQDLFLGNMEEFVSPSNPGATLITSPINNRTDLSSIVRFTYNNIAGTDRYHLDIAIDNSFSNIVQDLMIYRSDTTISLNNDQQYYARVRQENSSGISSWSSTITFRTAPPPPGNTSITIPIDNATKVTIPVQYTLLPATDATQYEIMVASEVSFTNIVKDTLVNNLSPIIPLTNATQFYTKARAKNGNGFGPWTNITSFTTIKATPSNTAIMNPSNNQIKPDTYVYFALMTSTNAESYEIMIAKDAAFVTMVKDTLILYHYPFPYAVAVIHLGYGFTYFAKARAINSDIEGEWCSTLTFKIDVATNIMEVIDEEPIVYPNPFNNFVSIKSPNNASNFKVDIFSSDGRHIKTLTTSVDEVIDLSSFKPGSYIIRISSLDPSIPSKTKIIIKK